MAKQSSAADQTVKISPFVSLTPRDIISTFIAGLIVGALYIGATYLLDTYVFSNFICRAEAAGDCSQAPRYALLVASVLAGLVGVALLVRLRIYRPLLIVVASLISVWGMPTALLALSLPLYVSIAIMAGLFGMTFAVFTWLIRIRSFVLALIAVAVVTVLLRLIFQS